MTTLNSSPVFFSSISSVKVIPSMSPVPEFQKKNKCQHDGCKKKLSLTDFPCKCGKTHCSSHRPSELHNCSFDYKMNYNKILQDTMIKVVGNKIDKI